MGTAGNGCQPLEDIQKIICLEIGYFPPPRIRHKGAPHQIFNFKTPAKSQTSSPTQTQLRHGDLGILLQMGHALQERDKNKLH